MIAINKYTLLTFSAAVSAFIIGIIAGSAISNSKPDTSLCDGSILYVEDSDTGAIDMYIQIDSDVEGLSKRKFGVFKVINKSYSGSNKKVAKA